MKKRIFKTFQYLIFLAAGIVIFWLIYRNLEIEDLVNALKRINYWWLGLALVLSLLSHVSRALRWRMLILPLGHDPKRLNAFFAVMIMYVTNLLIPRAGELARCSVLTKYEKVPFAKGLGTVVTERITDIFFMLLLTLIILFTQLPVLQDFFFQNPEIERNWDKLASTKNMAIIMALMLATGIIIYLSRAMLKKTLLYKKFVEIIKSFYLGAKSILHLRHPLLFIGHSIFIYLMYFLTMLATMKSFPPTENIEATAALVVFFMSTLAMLAPVQGGIGPYHFMVYKTLLLYGVASEDGKIFALIAHTSVNLLILLFGVLSLVFLPVYNDKDKEGNLKAKAKDTTNNSFNYM
jgi:hypothetical protein